MRQVFFYLIGAVIIFSNWSCSDSATKHKDIGRELTAAEKNLIASDNAFGISIFQKMVVAEEEPNTIISPFSIAMALGMAYNGAAGETRQAIQDCLVLGDLSPDEVNQSYRYLIDLLTDLDPKVKFEIANSLWNRQGFEIKPEFGGMLTRYFDATAASLDFNSPSAAERINAWVKEKTYGKIDAIVTPPIDPLMMMYLINAIYFKGDWTYQFNAQNTVDFPFMLDDGNTVTVKMMSQDITVPYLETESFKAVDLPYGDGAFSMTIFLPTLNDITHDVPDFIAAFTSEKLAGWIGSLEKTKISLLVPRFELKYESNLNAVLNAMGMGVAFDADNADFTNINDMKPLFISEVKHKTYIKVDEEGTTAAAVTSIGLGTTSIGPEIPVFCLDRPFVFAIREIKSGAVIFIGKIGNPNG